MEFLGGGATLLGLSPFLHQCDGARLPPEFVRRHCLVRSNRRRLADLGAISDFAELVFILCRISFCLCTFTFSTWSRLPERLFLYGADFGAVLRCVK